MCKYIKTTAAILVLAVGALLWCIVEYMGNEEEYPINYVEHR